MVSRVMGAFARAILVMIFIALPTLILPGMEMDSKQAASLVGLFLAALVFVEYSATYPGLIEFRHAPPFNRVRFLSAFATVFFLSVLVAGVTDPTRMSLLVMQTGTVIGMAIDFPYSPVRLVMLILPETATEIDQHLIRAAAGLSYLISLMTLSFFVILTRMGRWPEPNRPFNVWLNLPTFDPTAGGDVVDRLERDARVNLILGFLLPFLMPAAVKAASLNFMVVSLEAPQTMIWTMAAWSFLPASLFMRGIAMGRIADMIREKRRQAEVAASHSGITVPA